MSNNLITFAFQCREPNRAALQFASKHVWILSKQQYQRKTSENTNVTVKKTDGDVACKLFVTSVVKIGQNNFYRNDHKRHIYDVTEGFFYRISSFQDIWEKLLGGGSFRPPLDR